MKNYQKLLVVLFVVSIYLTGCEKEEEKTTYQIVNDFPKDANTGIEYLDGTLWEVEAFCYIGSEVVRQDNIAPIAPDGGMSEKKEVPLNYEKVKVSFKFLPRQSQYYDLDANRRKYVVAYLTLESGMNNVITITENTMVEYSLKNSGIGVSIENSFLKIQK